MKPKYIQVNCIEADKPDFRQAEAVLKFKPDIILLEYPQEIKTPDTVYNKYNIGNKPFSLISQQVERLEQQSINSQWIKSDILMWKNIAKLWSEGKDVLVYRVDADKELTQENYETWKNMYPSALRNWLWWVRIYLREKYMAKNVEWVLSNFKIIDKPTILVFLQSFHWKHVKFLLKNPSKDEIWRYYFGNFSEINQTNIIEKIKRNNKVFYKYWEKISDFR